MTYNILGDGLIEEDHLQVEHQERRHWKEEGRRLKEEEGHLLVVGQEEHRLMT